MELKEYWDKQDWDVSTFSYEEDSIMKQIQSSSSSAMSQLKRWVMREWILCLTGELVAILLIIFNPELSYFIAAFFIGGSFLFNGILLTKLLVRYNRFDISTETVSAIKNVLALFKEFGRIQKKSIPLLVGVSAVGGFLIGFLRSGKSPDALLGKWYVLLIMAGLIFLGWKYGYTWAKKLTSKRVGKHLNVLKENLRLLEEDTEGLDLNTC
ncbi:MAG: hypothetical protein AAF824_12240 [Bacteroidota bacterium]